MMSTQSIPLHGQRERKRTALLDRAILVAALPDSFR